MAASFLFYDVETSGFNPRTARIVQFAGQRTDMNLNPVGDPVNIIVKLTPDVVPDPDSVLVTGITPQKTIDEGVTEAEFLKVFYDQAVQPDTIFVGFNSVRFDDEFMRFLNYRNFYDAYEWQWKDGCSRWDILDLVRMTRALRPDGIKWPFAPDGRPSNRLELLTNVNKLDHFSAHEALSDVMATIAVAKLIKTKQPELFEYLLKNRGKHAVKELINQGSPFVYTTGRYRSEFMHTSAAVLLAKHDVQDAALVYDLRYDPTPFLTMSPEELTAAWQYSRDPDAVRLPVKTVKYNRCPAVAPLGVIKDKETQERIRLDLTTITRHMNILQQHRVEFAEKVADVISGLDKERERTQIAIVDNELTVDGRLYDGFIDKGDANMMRAVRVSQPDELARLSGNFQDARLKSLLPLYKARNFPKNLSSEELAAWDEFIAKKLMGGGAESRLAKYFARLQELEAGKLSDEQKYLVEELKLYGESIVPADEVG